MKYKLNKKQISVGVAVAYIVLAAFFSRGQSFYVVSDQPLEDIVAICHWSSSAFPGLHGGTHHVTRKKGVVVKSGEIGSCGMNWFAGLTLSFRSYDTLKHPTHDFFYVREREDGVSVVKAKSKLELLDEQKAKFEAGFWDKFKWPGPEYARNLVGCGFPPGYLSYYSEVKKVDKEHLKQLYGEPIFECLKRTIPIMKKYLRGYENYPSAEEYSDGMWHHDSWRKYE